MTYKDVVALMEEYGVIYDVHFQFKKDSNYPNVFISMLGARVARDAIKEGHKAVDANQFNLRGSRMKIDFAEKQVGKTLSRIMSAKHQASKNIVKKVSDNKPVIEYQSVIMVLPVVHEYNRQQMYWWLMRMRKKIGM
jgi:hypothetical protein